MTKCWGIFDQLESDGPGEIAAAAAAAASSRIVRVTSNYSEDEMAGKTVSPVLSWMIQHPVLSRLLQWWTQPTFKILLNKWGEDILPLNINMEPMEAENHVDSGKRKMIFHGGTSLILTGNNDEASEGGGFPDADHCLNDVDLGNIRIPCECKLYAKYIYALIIRKTTSSIWIFRIKWRVRGKVCMGLMTSSSRWKQGGAAHHSGALRALASSVE